MNTTILTDEQIETLFREHDDLYAFCHAIAAAVLQSPEIQALRRRVEAMEKIVAECRDAMPIPNVGSKAEECWPEAMSDAGGVPDFIKASVEALRKDAERFEFLRDNALLLSQIEQPGVSGWMVGRRDHVKTRFYTYNGQELVEAIDAALAQGDRHEQGNDA